MKMLRQIKGGSRLDWMKNVDNRERLRQEGVLDAVNRKQEKCKIKLQEMQSKRLLERWRTKHLVH